MPLPHTPPLTTSRGRPNSFASRSSAPRRPDARPTNGPTRRAGSGSPPKLVRIPVDPGDRAAHLFGHRHQVAIRLQHVDEVEHDEMGAGVDEHLGRITVVLGEADAPGAAVDEHVDRRIRRLGGEEVETFDRRRPVGEALGRARGARARARCCGAALERRRDWARRPPGRRRRRAPSGQGRARRAGPLPAAPPLAAPPRRRRQQPQRLLRLPPAARAA